MKNLRNAPRALSTKKDVKKILAEVNRLHTGVPGFKAFNFADRRDRAEPVYPAPRLALTSLVPGVHGQDVPLPTSGGGTRIQEMVASRQRN